MREQEKICPMIKETCLKKRCLFFNDAQSLCLLHLQYLNSLETQMLMTITLLKEDRKTMIDNASSLLEENEIETLTCAGAFQQYLEFLLIASDHPLYSTKLKKKLSDQKSQLMAALKKLS
jgi:hypothetical protein